MPESINLDHIGLLILIAGISGAGRSVATDALSDSGFFTVENLPVPLFPSFIEFTRRSPAKFVRTALSLDVDSHEKQEMLLRMLKDCIVKPEQMQLVFLDCKTEVIVKRYGQTRRPHPGFDPIKDQTLEDAIQREKRRLFAIREVSNLLIDTSELNVHDLRREIRSFVDSTGKQATKALRLNFLSFGFKHGVPIDCDLVVDTRFLPNPFFIEQLRDKTGKEQEVIDFVTQSGKAEKFVERYASLLNFLLPDYINGGKSYLNVGVGCTGGKHRSVVISQLLARRMAEATDSEKCIVSVKHRDIEKPH